MFSPFVHLVERLGIEPNRPIGRVVYSHARLHTGLPLQKRKKPPSGILRGRLSRLHRTVQLALLHLTLRVALGREQIDAPLPGDPFGSRGKIGAVAQGAHWEALTMS